MKLKVKGTKTILKVNDQVKMGMEVEKEHDDLTDGDPKKIRMIVDAHLKECPDYYTKLAKMEDDKEVDEKEK